MQEEEAGNLFGKKNVQEEEAGGIVGKIFVQEYVSGKMNLSWEWKNMCMRTLWENIFLVWFMVTFSSTLYLNIGTIIII